MADERTLVAEVALIRAAQKTAQERINVLELRMKVTEEEIAEQRRRDHDLALRLADIERQLGEP